MEFSHIEDLIRRYAHLTDEEVQGYVEGSLDRDSLEEVEKHLRSCVHCRTEVEILRECLDDPNRSSGEVISDDLVRQDVIRIFDRIRPPYNQIWIGDRSFPLEPSEEHPGLLRIKGRLTLAGFEDAIDLDKEASGNCILRIEGSGLNPIIVPMKEFKDVSDAGFEELKLAAKTGQEESRSAQDQSLDLELVFVCQLPDRKLEVLSEESSITLYLRLK